MVRAALSIALLVASCGGGGVPPVVEIERHEEASSLGRTYHVAQRHPEADDANPGTESAPWRTISRATGPGVLRPGDVVVIHEGVYRESLVPMDGGAPGARIAFRAATGEEVVISGADPTDDWIQQRDGSWRRAWTGPGLPAYGDEAVMRRELVVVRGRVLRPVARRDELAPGTFWVEGPDEAPRAIVARFEEGPEDVEVAHRTYLFLPGGEQAECGDAQTPGYFHVVGLTFRHASNRAQWGAVCAGSRGSLFEDVTVEWTNGQGIDVSGREHVFRNVASDHNGQMGWGGGCTSCLLVDSRAVGNNWKGYDPFWEAGGGKWARTSDTVLRRFFARDNEGPGIWFDIDNADNTIEASVVTGNRIAGIMLELRTVRTLVQHNEISGTRWLDWSGSGILSQAASHNVVLHNTITSNEGTGIWLRLDPDRRAEDGYTFVARNLVADNVTARDEEARQVAVEGSSREHVLTHRFFHNVFGAVRDAEPVWRSAFFVHPTGQEGGYRGDDLTAWRRLVDEEGTRMEPGGPLPDLARIPPAGAVGASPRIGTRVGARAEEVGLR